MCVNRNLVAGFIRSHRDIAKEIRVKNLDAFTMATDVCIQRLVTMRDTRDPVLYFFVDC